MLLPNNQTNNQLLPENNRGHWAPHLQQINYLHYREHLQKLHPKGKYQSYQKLQASS